MKTALPTAADSETAPTTAAESETAPTTAADSETAPTTAADSSLSSIRMVIGVGYGLVSSLVFKKVRHVIVLS